MEGEPVDTALPSKRLDLTHGASIVWTGQGCVWPIMASEGQGHLARSGHRFRGLDRSHVRWTSAAGNGVETWRRAVSMQAAGGAGEDRPTSAAPAPEDHMTVALG